ncbi:MAG: inorganic diphosphatase [Methylococcales bacterium]|jgi:inorganic pyrophosphatase|nr:inorganic diphosphatase [Methylococcales bacterium]
MPLYNVSAGKNTPHDINVIIEIPAQGNPVKYEVDKESAALFVDRFMGTAMQYPSNYGYIPQTLSSDGDPVDVLVITPVPLLSRCIIRCRPVGLLDVTDEAGPDPKILAVPIKKLTSFYDHIDEYQDFPDASLTTIAHFFEHYKDLEENKWVQVKGWLNKKYAYDEITKSITRYQISQQDRRELYRRSP